MQLPRLQYPVSGTLASEAAPNFGPFLLYSVTLLAPCDSISLVAVWEILLGRDFGKLWGLPSVFSLFQGSEFSAVFCSRSENIVLYVSFSFIVIYHGKSSLV